MARRNDHSREQIRQLALNATLDIIATQGLQGVSARKVAANIGYSAGSLYLVFDNLDDLILHANGVTLDALYVYLKQVPIDRQPEQYIQNLTQAYWAFAKQHPQLWLAIFEHIPETYTGPEWHQGQISRLFEILEAPFAQIMQGQSAERIAQSARVLWSSAQGICILTITEKFLVVKTQTTEQLLDDLVKTYLAGIRQLY